MNTNPEITVLLQEFNGRTNPAVEVPTAVAIIMAGQMHYDDGSGGTQLVPSQLDPARFKIPARKGRTFGFFFDGTEIPASLHRFDGKRCVVTLEFRDETGIVKTIGPLWDWLCKVTCNGTTVYCANEKWFPSPPLY